MCSGTGFPPVIHAQDARATAKGFRQYSTKVDLRRAKVAGRGTVEVCAATDAFRRQSKRNQQKFINQGEEDEKEVVSHKQCNRYLSMA